MGVRQREDPACIPGELAPPLLPPCPPPTHLESQAKDGEGADRPPHLMPTYFSLLIALLVELFPLEPP